MVQRTALITGSSRGIGKEIALSLAKAGFNVIINYKENEAAAEETLKEAGKHARAIKVRADIRSQDAVSKLFNKAKADFGFIDTLINNAGINYSGLFIDESEKDTQNVFETDILGAMRVTKVFLPDMLKNRFGRVVNMSSVWGLSGASFEVSYSSAKAALVGFTKALSKEVSPMGVTVNAIAPGLILTDMTKDIDKKVMKKLKDNIMAGRIGKPIDVANAALFLCSKDSDYISGQILGVNGEFIPASL